MSDRPSSASQATARADSPTAAPSERLEARLEALFQERLVKGSAPVLAAEVTRPGSAPVRVLRGSIDDTGHLPGERTAFRIASCTKSFTAAAALVLRRAGKLDLDTDVREWVPELRFTGPLVPDGPVTVRHLLTMSSGLPEDDPWADRQESMRAEEFTRLLSGGIRLASPPGARFRYSNLGYALLGRILERASGTDYRTLVSASLLTPLGLTDTVFAAGDLTVPVVRGYRQAPDGWEPLPFSGPGRFSPIGGLFSTLRDLRRWAAWLAAGPAAGASARPAAGASANGAPSGGVLAGGPSSGQVPDGPLDLADRAEMQRIHCPVPRRAEDFPGTRRGYGFGLNVLDHPQAGRIVFHSGGYPGFSAHMRWHPATGTIALGLENATYSRVGETVTRAFDTALGLMLEAAGTPAGDPAGEPALDVDQVRSGAGTWPELQAAREALTAWFARPAADTERILRARFAANLDQDQPWDERREEWLGLRRAAGPLAPERARIVGGDAPAELRWTLPGELGDLYFMMQLHPVEPPQVQRITVVLEPKEETVRNRD